MAYLQTTASSVGDILDAIAGFATGLGATVHSNRTFTSGANSRRILSLSFSGKDYAHFYSELTANDATKTSIYTARSIGLSTSGDWSTNTGLGHSAQTNLLTGGPYSNLWLFGEAGPHPYIHAVLEHAAGRYRHFGIGEMVKMGVWTGGAYSYGTNWSQLINVAISTPTHPNHHTPFSDQVIGTTVVGVSSVRCDDIETAANGTAGVDNRFVPFNTSSSRRAMTGLRGSAFGYSEHGIGYGSTTSFSTYNLRAHLFRLRTFVVSTGGYFRQIGEPPAIRTVSMAPFQPQEELTIGSDVWKIFPLVRAGIIINQESSGDYAFAYKKVI